MRKRKGSTPLMLLWSKAEQRRFIDAVERLVATVGDMQVIWREEKQERSARAQKAARTRKERSATGGNGSAAGTPQATPEGINGEQGKCEEGHS